MEDGDLVVMPKDGVVTRGESRVRLTPMEMEFFSFLCKRHGRVVSRGSAMQYLYQLRDDEPSEKIIDVMLCKVRRKLQPLGVVIRTSWGYGWALECDGKVRIDGEKELQEWTE
jgi:DNA-binding response OmpR family regulator